MSKPHRRPRAIRISRGMRSLIAALARVAAQDVGPRYCRNCGDPFDLAAENSVRQPSGSWRPCPSPSPGTPMVHCGVGGHMYTDQMPRVS